MLCSSQNFESKQLFALFSAIIIVSQLLTGFFMDRFGRKKIITIKVLGFLITLILLIVLGFVPSIPKDVVLGFFFLSLFFGTFFLDV
jgi:MFS family permease